MNVTTRIYLQPDALADALEAVTPESTTDGGSTDELDENLCNAVSSGSSSEDDTVLPKLGISLVPSIVRQSDPTAIVSSIGTPQGDANWNLVKVRVSFDITRKGERSLVINGYKFTKSRDGMGNRVFWRCSRRECKATAVTVADRVEHIRAVHNHDPPVATEFFTNTRTQHEQEVRFNSLSGGTSKTRVRRRSHPIPSSRADPQQFDMESSQPCDSNAKPNAEIFEQISPENTQTGRPVNGVSSSNLASIMSRLGSTDIREIDSNGKRVIQFVPHTSSLLANGYHLKNQGDDPTGDPGDLNNARPMVSCSSSLEELAAIATSFAKKVPYTQTNVNQAIPQSLSPVPSSTVAPTINPSNSTCTDNCTPPMPALGVQLLTNTHGQIILLPTKQLSNVFETAKPTAHLPSEMYSGLRHIDTSTIYTLARIANPSSNGTQPEMGYTGNGEQLLDPPFSGLHQGVHFRETRNNQLPISGDVEERYTKQDGLTTTYCCSITPSALNPTLFSVPLNHQSSPSSIAGHSATPLVLPAERIASHNEGLQSEHSPIHNGNFNPCSKLPLNANYLVHWKKEKMRESVEEEPSVESDYGHVASREQARERMDYVHSEERVPCVISTETNALRRKRCISSSQPPEEDYEHNSVCCCRYTRVTTVPNRQNNQEQWRNSDNTAQASQCIAHDTMDPATPLVNDEYTLCNQIQDGVLVKVLNTVQQLTAKLDGDADPPEVIQNCRAIQACLDTITALKRSRFSIQTEEISSSPFDPVELSTTDGLVDPSQKSFDGQPHRTRRNSVQTSHEFSSLRHMQSCV